MGESGQVDNSDPARQAKARQASQVRAKLVVEKEAKKKRVALNYTSCSWAGELQNTVCAIPYKSAY